MKLRVKNFHKLGLGLFVHFGIYSVAQKGEWFRNKGELSGIDYDNLLNNFYPSIGWAERLCEFAKCNGFKYITLTARHHDGFSLYDTKGLNNFDTTKINGNRDLVKEFVLACEKYCIKPFFYHTLIDWREEEQFSCFEDYLVYLRNSIKVLCSNYGEIGGLWFDGNWKYPNYDWQFSKLYEMVRALQPNAIITNNTGLSKLGVKENEYIDCVTYERNNINNFNIVENGYEYGAEMCQTLNSHWGYAKGDINYKSVAEIIENFVVCRKHGGNYLLNVGLTETGEIRSIEKEIINLFGQWVSINNAAVYNALPSTLVQNEEYFILKEDNVQYYFFLKVPMIIDPNVSVAKSLLKNVIINNNQLLSANWLDTNEPITIINNNNEYYFNVKPFEYGNDTIVRIAKLIYNS